MEKWQLRIRILDCGPFSTHIEKKIERKHCIISHHLELCVKEKEQEEGNHLSTLVQVIKGQFRKSKLWIKVSTVIILTVCEDYVSKNLWCYDDQIMPITYFMIEC